MASTLTSINPVVATNLAGVVTERLRGLISDGQLKPGDQVTETAVATSFGVSRGPAREAMKKLTQEGLLRYEPNRGTYVPELSTEDIVDIYRLRGAVETAAAEAVIERGDPASLRTLGGIVDKLGRAAGRRRWTEADRLDLEFHRSLVAASGSPRLVAAFATLSVETRMCLHLLRTGKFTHSEIADWHRRIVDAIRDEDAAEAHRAILDHNATALHDFLGSGEQP